MSPEVAVNRFGLGALPNELSVAAKDPLQYVLQQLHPIEFTTEFSSLDIAKRIVKQRRADRNKTNSAQNLSQIFYRNMNTAYIEQAITSEQSFMWRMLDFFSNHFSVTAQGAFLNGISGTLEREAIAPFLLENFTDMLLAVCKHPVMLKYLNNENSFGRNSRIGKRGKGLNENLAREILELHTLGDNTIYNQSDVVALANGISGWSVQTPSKATSSLFTFRTAGHEPGPQTLLNIAYPQSGIKQGEKMLQALAGHPATAKHLCFKLAAHVVNDQPPTSLVSALEQTWLATDGNLKAVYTTLIQHPLAWEPPQQKFKTPREFIISAYRGLGIKALDKGKTIRGLRDLGQAPFKAGSPAGYEDSEKFWNNGFAVMARIDWIMQHRKYSKQDITKLATTLLGEQLSQTTYQMIRRAESRERAFVLLFASPDFLRR